jgi:hypothetical protein
VPHKVRPGYANFAIDEPPLKLVLFENPYAGERLNHLGVEVFNREDLAAVTRRLEKTGMLDKTESGGTCCHATQDKIWSREPQGLNWEWYRITDDYPQDPAASSGPCAGSTVCCA